MEILLVIGAFLIGFVLVIISVPPVVRVAKAKKLFDAFNERKVHTKIVPPLGGVAIFIGFVLSSIIATDGLSFDSLKYIVASVIVMFFIGLKDDLMDISARKKLVIQFFAAVILVALGNVRFSNLQGVLGIHELNYFVSIVLSIFAVLVIINAFNLVDGIDGLASGLAMTAGTAFGIWFYISGNFQFAIMSFALVGSLAGFFLYNVFGNSNKLFMGDTGSLIIGIIVSALVVKFNELNLLSSPAYAVHAAPAVSFAIIIVPLIDVLRVMSIRIYQKRSPFSPDNNHVHHRLLKLYSKHLKVTSIIVTTNVLLIGFAFFLNSIIYSVNVQFVLLFLVGTGLTFIPSVLLKYRAVNRLKGRKMAKASS
jgi:UDP-N-acetylmuramyl pentapeptide phosphotransferase/UDP-N-acetylglucosamine-1-phosphate transferase